METETKSLLLTLREETAGLHSEAEQLPFAKALMGGTLPLSAYIEYLSQRLLFHAELDKAWAELLKARPELAEIIRPEYMQMQYLHEDAAYFKIDENAVKPSAGTQRAIALIQDADKNSSSKLIGHLYVHEGSKNGGMFLGKALRRIFQLPEGQGTRYQEPYGQEQRQKWGAFKETADNYGWTEKEREEILEGALDGFRTVIEIDREITV